MVDKTATKSVAYAGVLLALSALAGTGVMAFTHHHTKSIIAENQRQVLIRSLTSVLPQVYYDNDLINDFVTVIDGESLGSKQALSIFRARYQGKPRAVVITSVAPNGYNGPIKIIVGITRDGIISGVRVVSHRETPGLGDAIDVQRSDWILSFNGRTRQNTRSSQWQVKKDGGVFDQFTGATITPRAVVRAVHKSLEFFALRGDELFVMPQTTDATNG